LLNLSIQNIEAFQEQLQHVTMQGLPLPPQRIGQLFLARSQPAIP